MWTTIPFEYILLKILEWNWLRTPKSFIYSYYLILGKRMSCDVYTPIWGGSLICVCVRARVFTKPAVRAGCDTRSVFKQSNWFESRVFFNPKPVVIPSLRVKPALLFNHCPRENGWIHIFLRGISTMWNANRQVWDFVFILYDGNPIYIYMVRQNDLLDSKLPPYR